MRARGTEVGEDEAVEVRFEDRVLTARKGESLAATLAAHGEQGFRETEAGAKRGLYCGMGVCQECLVEVDGSANQRACMTKVDAPMAVRRQRSPAALSSPPQTLRNDPFPEAEIVVVGGGAGGLTAAAVAAEAGARVLVIDERPVPGGQYFKQPHAALASAPHVVGDTQFAGGRRLIERVQSAGVALRGGTVWNAGAKPELLVHDGAATQRLTPGALIVATGAYERALPVPGWTLPGVMTTGAAQTLLRSYGVLAGRRVLVAGNGPLNLQVAVELSGAGADVAAVAELSDAPGLGCMPALWRMWRASPDLLAQGRAYVRTLKRRGIPLHHGHVLSRVEPGDTGLVATVDRGSRDGPALRFEVDAVLTGYGFMPSNELLRLIGCAHDHDGRRGHLMTRRDADCRTTVESVYAVGDCCGLGGARAAQAEGVIAGAAAAAALGHASGTALRREIDDARARLLRERRFQDALWTLFHANYPGADSAAADTLICRCEEVALAGIERAFADGFTGMSEVKRLTRLGMGRCQGRYCAPLLADLAARRFGHVADEFTLFAPRPPVKPVPLGAIASDEAE